MGSWFDDKYVPDYTLVAAANAPARVRAKAGYRCSGVSGQDQVAIQRAIDEIGGAVYLTKGNYSLGPSSSSVEVSGNGSISSSETAYCKLDVGANHSLFSVGDVVSIRDGTPTLQSKNAEGLYAVYKVAGGDLGATEIQLGLDIDTAITAAAYVRPRWAINLKPSCSLIGTLKLATALSLANGSNCSGIWFSAPVLTQGGQELRHLSVYGNSANQTSDKWVTNGVLNGLAYDNFITDCELRYWKGTGLICTVGWGFSMTGGWIEDCDVGLSAESGFFEKVKIIQNPSASVVVTRNAYGGPVLTACELWAYGSNTRAILNRGRGTPLVIGGTMSADAGTGNAIYEAVTCDGTSPSGPIFEGVRFSLASTSLLLKLSTYLFGGRISGSLSGPYSPAALIDNPNYWIGGNLDLGGDAYGAAPSRCYIRSTACINATGGAFVSGRAYSWKPGTLDEVQVPLIANDPAFAGVNGIVAVPAGSRGFLTVLGACKLYVNADLGAIVANDLLSLAGGADLGSFKKAASTGMAVGLAREAKASGAGLILAELIEPRQVP